MNRPEATDAIDGPLGELSLLHVTHGFHAHGVSIASATLPRGWKKRTIPVRSAATRGNTGYCLESYDLAAGRLFAFREKDLAFVITLMVEDLGSSPA